MMTMSNKTIVIKILYEILDDLTNEFDAIMEEDDNIISLMNNRMKANEIIEVIRVLQEKED